jgi:hypothetical protein
LLRPDQALSAILIAANGSGFAELFDDVSYWGAGLGGLELRTATEGKYEYYRCKSLCTHLKPKFL